MCGQKKEDCCWVTKVVIAAVLGDDSEESSVRPKNGAYTNKIVEYEANGAIYFYSSDGLYTKLGNKLPSAETASVEYVDSQDRKTLRNAKDYTDSVISTSESEMKIYVGGKDATTLQSAKDYADGKATATLNSAQTYADGKDATTLQSAKDYADAQDALTLQAAKDYTDSAASSVVTRTYVDNGDANALATAKNYTDAEITAVTSSLATVATTGLYTDLSNTPVVPNIILSNVDPGEGQPLAANSYIGVYE
jgi:hypothetical protein